MEQSSGGGSFTRSACGFPLSALTRAFWALYPRSHSAMAEWLSPFFLYLPLCLAVTMWLGKKRL